MWAEVEGNSAEIRMQEKNADFSEVEFLCPGRRATHAGSSQLANAQRAGGALVPCPLLVAMLRPTLLAVEAKDAITWTKPADLTLPKDKDKLPPVGGLFKIGMNVRRPDKLSFAPHFLAPVGGLFKTGMNVLFFDASVRFIRHDVSADSFRKYVTPAGGKVLDGK